MKLHRLNELVPPTGVEHMPESITEVATRRIYGPDDRLTYEQVEAEFPELTKRYLRYQFESGRIDAYKGAGGMNYFRYSDLLALRESLRVSHARPGNRR